MDVRTPVLTALLLAGCLGDVPTGGNTGGTDGGSSSDPAETAWTTMITPIVTSTTHNCTEATACHGTLQPPQFSSWANFKASGFPAGKYVTKPGSMSFLITKGDGLMGMPHPLGNSLAKPYLDATEEATFAAFIDMYAP
ncbi:MAG TPA: hypothetical protein VGM39_26255 [Kofleriaceae bacterium]|jgi:hypothetical protein